MPAPLVVTRSRQARSQLLPVDHLRERWPGIKEHHVAIAPGDVRVAFTRSSKGEVDPRSASTQSFTVPLSLILYKARGPGDNLEASSYQDQVRASSERKSSSLLTNLSDTMT